MAMPATMPAMPATPAMPAMPPTASQLAVEVPVAKAKVGQKRKRIRVVHQPTLTRPTPTPALVHPVVQERLGPEDIKNAVARGLQKDFVDRCVQERSQ